VRARDLAQEYTSVRLDDPAMDAARVMAEHKLPGLLVLDGQDEPKAILPASQLIKVLVPGYVIEDPNLAAVIDERHADRLCESLRDRSVADCLPHAAAPPPIATPDDTAVEVAALMAGTRSPLVAVADRDAHGIHLIGVITASHLLEQLLQAAG
jgi:CBS domain-containing protein